ncbi:MAG: HAD family phosphatase [Bacteroidota bacterium]
MTTTIIFDFGGVLIDWNPHHLYQKIFDDEERMEYFLENICTSDWNEQQDGGRSIAEGTRLLVEQHPDWEQEIRAFYDRWEEMLNGPIQGTLDILKRLKESKQYKIYGLTNWSAETYPIAQKHYEFLSWFEGVLVSGEEKMKKPDPKFYQLLLDRFEIESSEAVFTDDNLRNVKAARAMGIPTIHFQNPAQLEEEMKAMKLVF